MQYSSIFHTLGHAEAGRDYEDQYKGQDHVELHVFTSVLGLELQLLGEKAC